MQLKGPILYISVISITNGAETILGSGPVNEIDAYFPQGSFKIVAEIFDEIGGFTKFVIRKQFDTLIPDKSEYDLYNIDKKIEDAQLVGDKNKISQILLADVSKKMIPKI